MSSQSTVIQYVVDNEVGFTYVDGDAGSHIEVSRTDGYDVELTTPEQVDQLIECLRLAKKEVWPTAQRITHGRHCTCSPCRREDWTSPDLAPCGMHGSDCPALYDPWGPAGSYRT